VEAAAAVLEAVRPYLVSVEVETRSKIAFGSVPDGAGFDEIELDSGPARVGLMPGAVAP
jgi:hypothetical protein